MAYNNSAKAKMERVAADEKDKKFSSKDGVKKLDSDIEAMVDGKTSGAKMYGKSKGPKMESNAQEKKNLMSDNPIASRASGGSWMSKHTKGGM
jgi:hypothetical protein